MLLYVMLCGQYPFLQPEDRSGLSDVNRYERAVQRALGSVEFAHAFKAQDSSSSSPPSPNFSHILPRSMFDQVKEFGTWPLQFT